MLYPFELEADGPKPIRARRDNASIVPVPFAPRARFIVHPRNWEEHFPSIWAEGASERYFLLEFSITLGSSRIDNELLTFPKDIAPSAIRRRDAGGGGGAELLDARGFEH
jgi:hypothetical protein